MALTTEQRRENMAKARAAKTAKQAPAETPVAVAEPPAPTQDAPLSDAEILLMMDDSQQAQEPGSVGTKPRLEHRASEDGDDPQPPMTARVMESAGYTWIYDSLTGDASLTNNNMLPQQLRKRRTDGSRVFVTRQPAVTVPKGSLKCLLHPERRDAALPQGIPTCRKANLMTEWDVQQHMRLCHKREQSAIQEIESQRNRVEDREFRQAMIANVKR